MPQYKHKKLHKVKKPNLVVDIHLNIDTERKYTEDRRDIDIIDDDDTLDELLNDLSHIKSKRSLELWTADNKEYINELPPPDKSHLLNLIRQRFYPTS